MVSKSTMKLLKKKSLMVTTKKLLKEKHKKKAKRSAKKRTSQKKKVQEARDMFTSQKMVNPCNIKQNRNLRMKRMLRRPVILQKMMQSLMMRKMGMITTTKRKKV